MKPETEDRRQLAANKRYVFIYTNAGFGRDIENVLVRNDWGPNEKGPPIRGIPFHRIYGSVTDSWDRA